MRPALFRRSSFGWSLLLADALPFLALSLTLRLFDRVDLLLFKMLGGSTGDAGLYAAAQNLAQGVSIISIAFPPLLLATLTRLRERGHDDDARALGTTAVRAVLWLLPLVGVAAAAGPATVTLLFGAPFARAGGLLAPLLLTAVAQVLVSVVIMILTAAGRPNVFLRVGVVMIFVAVGGGVLAIPRFGAIGAAGATLTAGLVGACAALALASRLAGQPPPFGSLARAGLATAAAYAVVRGLSPFMPTLPLLAAGGLSGLLGLLAVGELPLSAAWPLVAAVGRKPLGDEAG